MKPLKHSHGNLTIEALITGVLLVSLFAYSSMHVLNEYSALKKSIERENTLALKLVESNKAVKNKLDGFIWLNEAYSPQKNCLKRIIFVNRKTKVVC
ncbi:MAG: hypothetical protein ABH803_02175 [Candidatus Micrarchaeota archaeon]